MKWLGIDVEGSRGEINDTHKEFKIQQKLCML